MTFIGEKEISKIYKCTKILATKFHVEDVEVLPEKNLCEKYCFKNSCRSIYQIEFRKYEAICNPKVSHKKKITLCQKVNLITKPKNNSYSNFNVVALLITGIILSTSLGVLTYLYRRNITANRSETVSRT